MSEPAFVEKFVIQKGKTEPDNKNWIRVLYTLEISFPTGASEDGLNAVRATYETILDSWLSEHVAPPMPQMLMLMEEIEALEWHRSNWVKKDDRDRSAKPGEDAWIHRGRHDVSKLAEMINKAEGKLELTPYTFKFAGNKSDEFPEGVLIVRKVEERKAK